MLDFAHKQSTLTRERLGDSGWMDLSADENSCWMVSSTSENLIAGEHLYDFSSHAHLSGGEWSYGLGHLLYN